MEYLKNFEFDWKQYLSNNPDLVNAGITTQNKAWKHFVKFGKKEGRICNKINNTELFIAGRFGNMLFINLVCDYFARLNNIKMKYYNYEKFKELGINLYIGENTYNETIFLSDKNIDDIFLDNLKSSQKNISVEGDHWFQTRNIAKYIRGFIIDNVKKCKKREGVFIHVRLGDITNNCNEDYEYYDLALSNNIFTDGYISSDSIGHDICKKLIEKYSLKIYEGNEVETINFGSSFENIVLSKGTFSWSIGVLANGSNIYYPEKINGKIWHGDIFVFDDWKKIIY